MVMLITSGLGYSSDPVLIYPMIQTVS